MTIAKFTYDPPSLLMIEEDRFKHELDKSVEIIYKAHAQIQSTAVQAVVPGTAFEVVPGQQVVTGQQLGIQTGLSEVASVTASIDNGAAASALTLTARITPTDKTKIDLFVWQPTSSSVTTPIAATAAVTVHWWAVGKALAV